MADWSIKIEGKPGEAKFNPDFTGAKPGQPLQVQQGDLVSWNNTTGDDHWPWPCADDTYTVVIPPPCGQYLTAENVAPHTSSPWYNVVATKGTTIYYCCRWHQTERGKLVVVPFGQPPDTPTG